jgi:hypothetical protein
MTPLMSQLMTVTIALYHHTTADSISPLEKLS